MKKNTDHFVLYLIVSILPISIIYFIQYIDLPVIIYLALTKRRTK